MNQKQSFAKRAFITGIIGGLAMGLYMLLEALLGLHSEYIEIGQYTGYLRYLIMLIAIILTMRYVREALGDAGMAFGRAIGVGIIVTFGAAIIMGLMEMLYVSVLFPDFFDNYLALQLEQMRASGMSETEIAEMKDMALMWSTPGMNFLLYFIETTVIGTIFSLIAALFMKTNASADVAAATE